MKELGLQELLRYALSGGVGIASLLLMYPGLACLVGHIDSAEVTLLLGAILVLGTLIYNIHRGLLFPLIFRCVGLRTLYEKNTPRQFGNPWKPSEREIEIDRWRWKLTNEKRLRWDAWASHTHFLYCAGWATLASFIFGFCIDGSPSCQAWWILGVLLFLSFSAAWANNYRLLYSINAEMKRETESFTALIK
jgi:hypothetical protein